MWRRWMWWWLLWPAAVDAGSRPVIALGPVTPDRCGGVSGTVEVRARGRAREVELLVGEQPVAAVTVPARAETVPFRIPLGARKAGALTARWKYLDSEPVWVETPAWDVVASWTPWPEVPPQGEVPALEVRALSSCAVDDLLTVSATVVEDGRPLLHGAKLRDGAAQVPVGDLPQGRWRLRVELSEGDEIVARAEVPLEVGAPCEDLDGDGHLSCRAGDCDDRNPAVHPGAKEIAGNGLDDDCDGINGQDRDHDGFEDRKAGGDDCDDADPLVYPGAAKFPDPDGDGASDREPVDFDCDGDVDQRPGAFDCDETDPRIPRAEDPDPNGVDDDCDGIVDEGTVAYDDDGDGLSELQGDCDDTSARVRPGATELPDCRDNDCDGSVDEGVVRPAKDDRYEPNDSESRDIGGATYKPGLFGGHYKGSRAALGLVTRDLGDVERFSVFAHDGGFDSFHVTVRLDDLGDDRGYQISITGPRGQSASGLLVRPGEAVSVPGTPALDDTGNYRIEVRPVTGELPWCPVSLVVSTG